MYIKKKLRAKYILKQLYITKAMGVERSSYTSLVGDKHFPVFVYKVINSVQVAS